MMQSFLTLAALREPSINMHRLLKLFCFDNRCHGKITKKKHTFKESSLCDLRVENWMKPSHKLLYCFDPFWVKVNISQNRRGLQQASLYHLTMCNDCVACSIRSLSNFSLLFTNCNLIGSVRILAADTKTWRNSPDSL